SRKEFAAKLGVVVEEADESVFWPELLTDAGLVEAERVAVLRDEADHLVALFAASYRTASRPPPSDPPIPLRPDDPKPDRPRAPLCGGVPHGEPPAPLRSPDHTMIR